MLPHLLQRIYKGRWGYFFMLPAYIFFAIFTLKPFFDGFRLSFYETTLVAEYYVGLENFFEIFRDQVFLIALRNTIIFVLAVVPTALALSIFVAVIIFPLSQKIHTFVRLAFYLPVVAGAVVLSMIWLWIFNPTYGLLNYILSLINLGPVEWLGSYAWALPSTIVVVISWILGQPIILLLAALGGVPPELWEASLIDGATRWQQFWKITLPLLKPTAFFVLVTQTIGVFQVYVVILLLTRGGPGYATQTIVYRIWEIAFRFYNFGYAAAMSFILLIMVTVIAIFQLKYLGGEIEY